MPWNDDSWRDSYDSWKLRSPDEEYGYDEEPCDHEDYDINIISGEWSCDRCNEHRPATNDEIQRMYRHLADYAEHEARESRRQWWRDRTYPVRMFLHRVLLRIWPRKACSVLTDDEIPF